MCPSSASTVDSGTPASHHLRGQCLPDSRAKGIWSVILQASRKIPSVIDELLQRHSVPSGEVSAFLENWSSAFPHVRPKRWYSTQLGDLIYMLDLDSNSSLLPGSAQIIWARNELTSLPRSIRYVFVNLHHPPVSDFRKLGDASHNARENEIAPSISSPTYGTENTCVSS
jgi:hypothetical protein